MLFFTRSPEVLSILQSLARLCGALRFRHGPGLYTMFPAWRPFVFLIFGVMAVAGFFILFNSGSASKSGPGLLFGIAWFLILFWNAYWFFFRLSYRIELDGDRVRWFTPLLHGEFPIDDLVSIGSSPLRYQLATFKRQSGRGPIVLVQGGLSEFADEVHRRAPHVTVTTVTTGLYQKVLQRTSTWNGFRRDK